MSYRMIIVMLLAMGLAMFITQMIGDLK